MDTLEIDCIMFSIVFLLFTSFCPFQTTIIQAAHGLKAFQTCAALSLNGIGIHGDWVSHVMCKEVTEPSLWILVECLHTKTGLAHSTENGYQKKERERGVILRCLC